MENQTPLILAKDWDILCIFDACRFDYFEEQYGDHLEGSLQRVRSPASCTFDWVKATLLDGFSDVIYVSAHPFINKRAGAYHHTFACHDIVEVWDWGYDEKEQTVLPSTVTLATLQTLHRHPNHRLIVHYIQPHVPFIGLGIQTDALSFPTRVAKGEQDAREVFFQKNLFVENLVDCLGIEAVKDAYRRNLDAVLREIPPLTGLNKKIVITADHGEGLGDEGWCFDHPCGSNYPVLREVPWLEINS